MGFCGWREEEEGGRGRRAAHRGCLPIAQGQFCRYSSATAAWFTWLTLNKVKTKWTNKVTKLTKKKKNLSKRGRHEAPN